MNGVEKYYASRDGLDLDRISGDLCLLYKTFGPIEPTRSYKNIFKQSHMLRCTPAAVFSCARLAMSYAKRDSDTVRIKALLRLQNVFNGSFKRGIWKHTPASTYHALSRANVENRVVQILEFCHQRRYAAETAKETEK